MTKTKPHILLLTLLISGILLIQGCSEDNTGPKAAMEAAPDFEITLFSGGKFRLSEQRGKAVVINFFASWCRSCGEDTPVIEKISREYAAEDVVLLAIAVDDTESKAKAFMKKIGLTIPAGLDRTGKIKDAFGLYGMPTTYFIDKNGMISYFHAGVVTEQLLKHEIDKLL
jgi:cytochrome c biogenesis protein CcmG/thiol:disulfide interchange protein DsbE